MDTEGGTSDDEVVIEDGNEIHCLKNEAINNGVAVVSGNKVRCLKNESVNNGMSIADVVEGQEIRCLKNKIVNSVVAIADGNCDVEGIEVGCSKNETVNNGVVIADGNSVAKGKEVRCLKKRTISNGVEIANGKGFAEWGSGGVKYLLTYKRRKHVKSSCESKIPERNKGCVEAASHLSDQAMKKPCSVGNTSKDYSHGQCGNVLLNHLYHSLGGNNGSIEGCIREALMNYPKFSCAPTITETFKIDKDDQECSSNLEQLSHRSHNETNGDDIMHSGCSSESDSRGGTEKCQRVFCDILTSEKFSSLCKVLLENFQGFKPQSLFDFSVINTRMKEQDYENSPMLFLSDIEQVWRNLQDAGNEIVSITKSLSDMSRASYCEKFRNWDSNSRMKPEQTKEHATEKISTCRRCGKKADGMDCLICDSCEEKYHMPCIEPTAKEIRHKSWFCANCSGKEIESQHENCVVCERLNVSKTMNNIASEKTIPTNEETLTELEESSNHTLDDEIQVSIAGRNSCECKICGEEVDGENIKICGHPFCPSKYYHVRCLSSKLVKLYAKCWYCPSCLCQVCVTDQDDDKIVLCDSCDHAYHIYCMKPPRTSVPKGKWFCRKCDAGIQAIRRAKKAHESKKWNNKRRRRDSDKAGGMDMLLTAANTLSFEENLTTTQIDSQRS